jgi:chromate transporter
MSSAAWWIEAVESPPVTFRDAFWVWCRVALLSFGGPAGQIAVMHRILVDEKKWINESRFLHALNYCMLLPGPEAQQLSIYIGWMLHRTWGGIVAGTLFVLPGFVSILALSILYTVYGEWTAVQGLFYGLKPAIIAVVAAAALRMGQRVLRQPALVAAAIVSFVAIFFLNVPFPWIVAMAGLLGLIAGTLWPGIWGAPGHRAGSVVDPSEVAERQQSQDQGARPGLLRTLRTASVWLAVWWVPIALLATIFGVDSVFTQEALFFSKASLVTFGGAYSVLAYVAQECVVTYGWLQPGEMLDGMGMAESTPGPLIQVVQFVGFTGAYRNPGSLSPMAAAVLGSVVTTWVTFVPCFLWIFTGAPYIESLRGNVKLNAIMAAISAAVVGVIFNLAIWFSLNTVFAKVTEVHGFGLRWWLPSWETIDPAAVAIAACAFVAIFRFKLGLIQTLAGSVAAGFCYYTLVMA